MATRTHRHNNIKVRHLMSLAQTPECLTLVLHTALVTKFSACVALRIRSRVSRSTSRIGASLRKRSLRYIVSLAMFSMIYRSISFSALTSKPRLKLIRPLKSPKHLPTLMLRTFGQISTTQAPSLRTCVDVSVRRYVD